MDHAISESVDPQCFAGCQQVGIIDLLKIEWTARCICFHTIVGDPTQEVPYRALDHGREAYQVPAGLDLYGDLRLNNACDCPNAGLGAKDPDPHALIDVGQVIERF